jgi:putative FmdB family regulatory protein
MPIFEYQCEKCRKVSNFLVRDVKKHKPPACPKCGHPKTSRLFSRFMAAKKSKGQSDMSDASDKSDPSDMPDLAGLDENDPRSLGRAMRKMAEDTGEAMPPEMDEMCRRLESGEDPEKIEAEMGDVLGDEGGPGADGGGGDNTLYDA